MNTVRRDTTSGLGPSFGADLPVPGICAYTVRLVAQYRGHSDVPCWELRYVDHPGRNDDDGRKTDTVCPTNHSIFRDRVMPSPQILLSLNFETRAYLIRSFIFTGMPFGLGSSQMK